MLQLRQRPFSPSALLTVDADSVLSAAACHWTKGLIQTSASRPLPDGVTEVECQLFLTPYFVKSRRLPNGAGPVALRRSCDAAPRRGSTGWLGELP